MDKWPILLSYAAHFRKLKSYLVIHICNTTPSFSCLEVTKIDIENNLG